MEAEYLTPAQLAELLQVPTSWVYSRSRFNEIPGMVKLGHYCRWNKQIIEAWLLEQTNGNGEGKSGYGQRIL